MNPHDPNHLSADELDAFLTESSAALVASHLATCPACAAMVRDDARVIAALGALRPFDPAPDFVDRVMSRLEVPSPVVALAAGTTSPRAVAARRRAIVALVLTGGGIAAGFVWAAAHPGAALSWSSPAVNDIGHALWVSLQTVVANAREQAWFASVRDTLATPARALLSIAIVAGAYAIGLTGLRRLMTEPATHAAW